MIAPRPSPLATVHSPLDDFGAAIARELGLRFDGEQHWFGVPPMWAFTDANPRSPTHCLTFYMPPGSTLCQVSKRFEEKRQEEEAALAAPATGRSTLDTLPNTPSQVVPTSQVQP